MNILVIDAQGGGIGKQLVTKIRDRFPEVELIAIGTNSAATGAMIKAGASRAATGENSVCTCAEYADVIVGPIGIVIANSMLGEITPKMAEAVGKSHAKRVLIPVSLNHCRTMVAGQTDQPMGQLIDDAVEKIAQIEATLIR